MESTFYDSNTSVSFINVQYPPEGTVVEFCYGCTRYGVWLVTLLGWILLTTPPCSSYTVPESTYTLCMHASFNQVNIHSKSTLQ